MCGVVNLPSLPEVVRHYGIDDVVNYPNQPQGLAMGGRGDHVFTIFPKDGHKAITSLRWGFPLSQSKRAYNARVENLHLSSFWSDAFHNRRCVVPVKNFLEGNAIFSAPGLMSFAGIISKHGEVSVVTTPSTQQVARYHSRMPLILNKDDLDEWLMADDMTTHRASELQTSQPLMTFPLAERRQRVPG